MWETLVTWIIKALLEVIYEVVIKAARIEAALGKENARLKKKVDTLQGAIDAVRSRIDHGEKPIPEEIERLLDAGDDLNRTFF